MSWRIATDPNPDDPNPHAWQVGSLAFATEQEATYYAQSEEDELVSEYGQEYAADNYRWLIIEDARMEVNVT